MKAPVRLEIIQVNLDKPLRALSLPENAAGAYLVFWWNDIPLGHALVRAGEFPINETDLQLRAARAIAPAVGNYSLENGFKPALPLLEQDSAHDLPVTLESLALSRPLENLAFKDSPAGWQPSVSVIVCTCRRPAQLRRCLTALRQLDPSATEIVVLDNAPDEPCAVDVVKEFDGVIYWPEPAPGLSRARNSGISHSSGEIVAFTDDDVVVHPRWLVGFREVLSRPGILGATGLVLAAELETESQIRFEFDLDGFNRGYRPITFDSSFFNGMLKRGVSVWKIGSGANMAFRREVFSRIGLFDERLGAGASGGSEDSEFWYRMLAAGMSIAYEPRAVVWHRHRADPDAFRKQMKQYMRGHVTALLVQFEKHRHIGNLRRLFTELPYYYFQRLRSANYWGALGRLLFGELLGCAWGFVTYFRQSLPKFFASGRRTNPLNRKSVS
jgi:GT2 family glycosyltransferase